MFGVADEESSDQLTEEFTNIQRKIFTPVGLHYRYSAQLIYDISVRNDNWSHFARWGKLYWGTNRSNMPRISHENLIEKHTSET